MLEPAPRFGHVKACEKILTFISERRNEMDTKQAIKLAAIEALASQKSMEYLTKDPWNAKISLEDLVGRGCSLESIQIQLSRESSSKTIGRAMVLAIKDYPLMIPVLCTAYIQLTTLDLSNSPNLTDSGLAHFGEGTIRRWSREGIVVGTLTRTTH